MANSIDSDIIDICTIYIEDKDCFYLAKEGQIVNYTSITGRKTDYMWHKLNMLEVLRIIRAMRLNEEGAKELREHHLIAAFQELGRVYEFGVKSRHVTAVGIFNYSKHSDMSVGDEAMCILVESLQMQGLTAILMNSVIELFNSIQEKLRLKLSSSVQRELMYKYFEAVGYTIKTGANRPLINGRKQPAIMMNKTKPAEVVSISEELKHKLLVKIYGELV